MTGKRKKNLSLLALVLFFCLPPTAPQADVEPEDQLTDFPKQVEINVVDVAKLEAKKESFGDLFSPETDLLQMIFPKERPSTAYAQSDRSGAAMRSVSDFKAILTAAPSLPQSLFYQALISENLQAVNLMLRLDGLNMSDQRNQGRGNYVANDLRGAMRYGDEKSSLVAETNYRSKELGWLSINEDSTFRNLMSMFELYLKTDRSLSSKLKGELEVSGKSLEAKVDRSKTPSAILDLRASSRLKPGQDLKSLQTTAFVLEYFASKSPNSSEDIWELLGRLQFRDLIRGSDPFSVRVSAEFASAPIGPKTEIFFNPEISLKTLWNPNFEVEANFRGELFRPEIDDLYYNRDFVRINPFLELERSWTSQLQLRYASTDTWLQISDSYRVVDRLAVFVPLTLSPDLGSDELTYIPTNANVRLNEVEAKLEIRKGSYTLLGRVAHEFQKAAGMRRIPYRPADRISVKIGYDPAMAELNNPNFELSAEWVGQRYAHPDSDETLLPYLVADFRVKNRLSGNMIVFLEYQVAKNLELFKGYKLASNALAFGVTLMFR